jgi:hypothetical protein
MNNLSNNRPLVLTYDSGYEHSLEHWIETRRLVAEADEVSQPATQSTQDQELKLVKRAS